MVERHKQPRYDAQLFILSKREYAGNVPRRRSERFVDLTTAVDGCSERTAADTLPELPHNLACSPVIKTLAQVWVVCCRRV
jgi:hypothetical protein